jgi:DMSO/TMAO reductase YedYZ molybdopterin-dependent catalytic subunit
MHERRRFLRRATLALSAAVLAGCDRISQSSWGPQILGTAETLNRHVQRLLSPASTLAQEYTEADISPVFHPNGSTNPQTDEYLMLAANGFKDYQLQVDGLVERPARLSIDQLQQLAQRTQITRHDCVEGWSAIGKWHGTPLAAVLAHVGVKPAARFVVFHCFDEMDEDTPYYESIDLEEANHPQTVLAFLMNDRPLPVANGAPLRLRVERQLGYKQAKYIKRLELVSSYKDIGDGNGGYWEDQGYEWYAGI